MAIKDLSTDVLMKIAGPNQTSSVRSLSSIPTEDLVKMAGKSRKSVFQQIPPEEQVKHPYMTAAAQTAQDVLTIPAHFANQFLLDYPRRITEHFGYEYPSETKNIAAGVAAKTAGVLGGIKNPVFRAIGGIGKTLGKNILAGAITGAAYSPSKFESPEQVATEQAGKAAFGAAIPAAGRIMAKAAPSIGGFGKYVFSKGAGLSKTTMDTVSRVGFQKIRDVAGKGVNYIQENVIPKARQNLIKNITKAGDASKELLQEMGFNPDQIDDVMKISADTMKKHGKLINESWVKTEANISNAMKNVGKQIGNFYTQAAKEGRRVNISNTLSTMRNQLKNYGVMDESGNLMGDYKTHPSTSIKNLAQLYADYAPRVGKEGISVPDFLNFRTRLEASVTKLVENEKFNVPIYKARKTLKEDSIRSLVAKGSPYEKYWRGINREYSDLATLDDLSKKINSVVNKLPEKISTQRKKLTESHSKLYGKDVISDVEAYNAAQELYPEKETLGLFNIQKPVIRTAFKATEAVKEAAKPFISPIARKAGEIGQAGTNRLKQYMESPMTGPGTKRLLLGNKGQAGLVGAGAIGIAAIDAGQAQAGENVDMERIYKIESSGNPKAHNVKEDARGLGQIRPIVLKEWNQFNPKEQHKADDLFKPEINKKISDWYMNNRIPAMLKAYKKPDTIQNRIVAYNAGISYVRKNKSIPESTKAYLKKYGL